MDNRIYLGDGVYAIWSGYDIELRTGDIDNPDDVIYLEPRTLDALNNFYTEMKKGLA